MMGEKQAVSQEIRVKMQEIKQIYQEGCGCLLDFSQELDQLMVGKKNLERVNTLLKDYINIDSEMDELKSMIDSSKHVI